MSQETFSDPGRLAQQLLSAANSLTDEEAGRRYQQILGQLPREEAAQLNALALTQVAPDQRRVLASGLKQAHQDPNSAFDGYDDDDDEVAATPQRLGQMSAKAAQQDPALVNNLFGGENSALGGQVGKAALAALAALLIRKFLGGQQQSADSMGSFGGSGAGMDPVSMILGSLLGGGGGGGSYQQSQGGAGDLGSILGQVLGGAGAQQMPSGRAQQQMPGGDLGSILGQVLGGQQGGGAGDLGSILGQVLGGQQGGAQQMPSRSGGSQAGGPDLGSILGSILGGGGSTSHRKD